jgi:hypothetical protein
VLHRLCLEVQLAQLLVHHSPPVQSAKRSKVQAVSLQVEVELLVQLGLVLGRRGLPPQGRPEVLPMGQLVLLQEVLLLQQEV